MATDIVLRSVKAASLTHAEMDQNWQSLAQTVDAVTSNKTVAVADQNKILEVSISTGTITLPTVANASGTDTDSFKITIKNINATSLTIDGNGSETIEGAASVTLLENESAEFTLSSGAAEWNITGFYNPNLVGITSSTTEINILNGLLASTTELNILNGLLASTAELNILNGVLASTAEINILNGLTATTAELNFTSGVSSAIQTQIDTKAVKGANSDITSLSGLTTALSIAQGGSAATSAAAALVNFGLTATASEINAICDGKTLTSGDDKIDNFPAGTLITFQQTSAPTGWTKQTTHNDKAFRVVSGTAGSGGTDAFTTSFGSGKTTDSHTLTTSQIPAHTHTIPTRANGDLGTVSSQPGDTANGTVTSNSTGGGGGHTHTLNNFDLQFVDLIIASKA